MAQRSSAADALPPECAGAAQAWQGQDSKQAQRAHAQAQTLAPLSAWTSPKTDWTVRDVFDLVPDYARVRGNLLHLHAAAARLYPPFPLEKMRDYAIGDVAELAFFSSVDNNTDALLNNTFCPAHTRRARAYAENGAVWTADDLNRMERAHAQLYSDMRAQENGRTALKFTMGGGLLGACL